MSFFKRNNPNVLGIDVSSSAIKLIELSRHGSRYRVESYAVAALPENAVIDNNFADIEATIKIPDHEPITLRWNGRHDKAVYTFFGSKYLREKVNLEIN